MKTWTIAGALLMAGTIMTAPALAQTTSPSGAESKDKAKSDTMKSDTSKTEGGAAKAGGRAAGGAKEQVRAVQQALKDKGHDPGQVDGVMGPKTQAALRDFQSKEGIKASGRLDSETMSKLGVQAKAGASAGSSSSSPSASPSGSSSPQSSGGTPSAAPKK